MARSSKAARSSPPGDKAGSLAWSSQSSTVLELDAATERVGDGRVNDLGEFGARFIKDRSIKRSREIAYEAIKDAILRGVFPPRERLIEERLGAALGISRTPVREALVILEYEGLIESIPYKGLVVKRITVEEFLRMYEALGVIEAAIAHDAAHHATPHDVSKLEALLDEAERTIPYSVPAHLAACRAFQQRLGQCAQNPYLTKMLLNIEERSDVYLIHTHHDLPAERMLAAVQDRRAILEAVRARDPDAAARAARAHAEAIRTRWRDLYCREDP